MIDAYTKLYGVFGDPVSHSLSPAMHNAAFAHIGRNAVYLAFAVKDLKSAVEGVRGLGIHGVSVTIPHKISIIPMLDELDPVARRIGAVNTVINRNGVLYGTNSDGMGAVSALKEKTQLRGKRAVIAGAGGSARAIGHCVIEEGADVTILNRSKENGEKLASDIGAEFLPIAESGRIEFDILINTTPVGMTPDIDGVPIPPEILRPGATVMDIIYNPLKTKLLKEAEQRGCAIVDGVSMFVNQGAVQFTLWTGREAPVDIMRRVVLNALETKNI